MGNDFLQKDFFSSFKYFYSNNLYLFVYNIKGFDLSPMESPSMSESRIDMIEFWRTSFVFYVNKSTVLTKEMCTLKTFQQKNLQNFFSFAYIVSFYSRISYSTEVCPYVFFYSAQHKISFRGITNSLLYKNQLGFMDVDSDRDTLKYSNLAIVELEVIYEEITHKLLNKLVFKRIHGLYLTGIVYNIQAELFASFSQVKIIYLCLDDFGVFFSKGLAWLNTLNTDVIMNLTSRTLQTDLYEAVTLVFADKSFVFKQVYTYPDEDICLFRDFPHAHMVFPMIHSGEYLQCSCTIVWLIQYARFYLMPDSDSLTYSYDLYPAKEEDTLNVRHCMSEPNLTRLVSQCDFASKLSKCRVANLKTNTPKEGFFGIRVVEFHYKWLQYVVEVYMQTVLCILGMLTNTLTILVISNRSTHEYKKSFNNIMYKHMLANSVLNLFYCMLKAFALVNICIFPKSSFCSTILEAESSQYWKIYGNFFVGNTLRLCMNISYIGFSASRFFLSTSSKSSCLKKLANLKWFYLLALLFSVIASVFKVFQYKANTFYSSGEADFPLDIYGIYRCKTSKLQFKCKLFTIFNLINNVLNNIVFFVISIFIDICLIRFAQKILASKRQLFATNDIEISKAENLKEKVVQLTIVNGLLYFLSHVPDFVVTVLILVYRRTFEAICFNLFSCVEIIEIAQAFNFCSISFQFFVFVKFDRFFMQSLINISRRAICIQKNSINKESKNISHSR